MTNAIERKKSSSNLVNIQEIHPKRKQKKSSRLVELASLMGRNIVPTNITQESTQDTSFGPEVIARKEIHNYKYAVFSESDIKKETFELAEWWNKAEQKKEHKYLSVVTCDFLGTKPGSSGLECDIGSVSDVVYSEIGSIKPGMIKVGLFLKLNRKEMIMDWIKIECLGKSWEIKFLQGQTIFQTIL